MQEFNKISFKDQEEENDFIGYCANIMSNKLAGPVPYNHIGILEKSLCSSEIFALCYNCSDVQLIENLPRGTDVYDIELSYSFYAKAANIIWTDDDPICLSMIINAKPIKVH